MTDIEPRKKRMPLYVPLGFMVAGLALFTLSVIFFSLWIPRLGDAAALSNGGVKTSGTITEIRSKVPTAAKSNKYYDATIEYGMDGQYYSAIGVVKSKYVVGDSIAITYNPQDTSVISVDDTNGAAIGSIVLAIALGLLGLGGIVLSLFLLRIR